MTSAPFSAGSPSMISGFLAFREFPQPRAARAGHSLRETSWGTDSRPYRFSQARKCHAPEFQVFR